MKRIKFPHHKIVLIDDEDLHYFKHQKWTVMKSNYLECSVGSVRILFHRLIMNAPEGSDIDHINHNILDNRKCNLRICSTQQNLQNSHKRKDNTSRYKGVCKSGKKWSATIQINGKRKNLGTFESPKFAAIAYNLAAKKYFKEFAYLNKI